MLKVLIFPTFFKQYGLSSPLLACHSFAIRFQYMQYRIGFIDISDALTEATLDHPKEHQKSKNERHAAWERFGKKRNERHAAWERFLNIARPGMVPKMGVPKTLPIGKIKRRSAKTEQIDFK